MWTALQSKVELRLAWCAYAALFFAICLPDGSLAQIDRTHGPFDPAVVIDQEFQSPEGRATAYCNVYWKSGDEYKSTKESINAEEIETLRSIILASESKQGLNLSDFGITKESVEANRSTMLRSAFTPSISRSIGRDPLFETLPPHLKTHFEYKTVEKNALSILQDSYNSAYSCIHIKLPGAPALELSSRHDSSEYLPWTIKCDGRYWQTYDTQINIQLAKLFPSLAESLNSKRTPAMSRLRFTNKSDDISWSDGFFTNYGNFTRTQVSVFEGTEAAKQLVDWAEVSSLLEIEDAWKRDSRIDLQVKLKSSDCIVDRFRFAIDPKDPKSETSLKSWTEFLNLRNEVENAAESTRWMKLWKTAKPERAIEYVQKGRDTPLLSEYRGGGDVVSWVGNKNAPGHFFYLYENTSAKRIAFIWPPYSKSIVADSGPLYPQLAKVMTGRPNFETPLRAYQGSGQIISEGKSFLIDSNGNIVKESNSSSIHALAANWPAPIVDDEKYDSWGGDTTKREDLDFIAHKFTPTEKIDGARSQLPPTLTGLIDRSGTIVCEAKWKYIWGFHDGLARVCSKDGKYGFIDKTGNTEIAPIYEYADDFHEGLSLVSDKTGNYGYLDLSGKLAIPIQIERAHRFSEGLAAVKKGTLYGYIDKSGKFIIRPQFYRARHFINGLAVVQIDSKQAYIDKNGNILGNQFYEKLERFVDNRALFRQDGKYGYIDNSGKVIIPAKYKRAETFSNGGARVEEDGKICKIDIYGKVTGHPKPESEFDAPHDGLIRFDENYIYGFKNENGKVVIKPIYNNARNFSNGFCAVELKKLWGVIDKKGTSVISPQFDEIVPAISEGKVIFKSNGKWGVMEVTGKLLLPPTFDRIYPFCDGMAVVQKGIKFGYIDSTGTVAIPPQFDAAHRFDQSGLAHFNKRLESVEEFSFP